MGARTRTIRAVIAPLLVVLVPWGMGVGPTGASGQEASRRFSARSATPSDLPRPIDDLTIRPTVMVRKGTARGSGTIIGSTKGRSLILTAAHVIDGPGELQIELHRYNLGIEGRKLGGNWPKVVPARAVAADPEADVAVLLVEGLAKLPYVASIDTGIDRPPTEGAAVVSVGIDHASDLNSWESRVRGTAWLSRTAASPEGDGPDPGPRGKGGTPRLFLITEHPPIKGRSGGGLFSSEGKLLGLCVGRIEIKQAGGEEAAIGLFASGPSILKVLEQLETDDSAPK
ncbi:S1 family peptidase [Tautonia sociabilis]|uniref:Serine protease n=1 Tax=Tautonia sociabilis TaxID=2080755 RepID=A0A432MGJ7_9BACT|nr:serine protease [Tautonia sociabilis]RUL85834.1 serine protease [Tautonia sociabilis]